MDIITKTALLDTDALKDVLNRGYLKGIRQCVLREFTEASGRDKLADEIIGQKYMWDIPRQFFIPKKEIDPETHKPKMRGVIANSEKDRVVFALIMRALFKCLPQMIHERCKSYMKGTSCSMVVKELADVICMLKKYKTGRKYDISKYFDSLPIEDIDLQFNLMTIIIGEKSPAIELCRSYYHDNRFYDSEGVLQDKYMSLKQGCAIASFLADSALYTLDKKISELNVYYVRYCDDIVIIGEDLEKADAILREELAAHGLKINDKKVETITNDRWFKFLGFSIKGDQISLSENAIKSFQEMIEHATFKNKNKSREYNVIKRRVNKALYSGYMGYSWAKRYLLSINNEEDINQLNTFIMDAIRATITGRNHIGGLGWNRYSKNGCIQRGIGKNVKANRDKVNNLEGYYTLRCMRDNLRTNKAAYECLVRNMI